MSLTTKILIWLGVIILVGALGFIIFKQIENSNRQDALNTQMVQQQQLLDNITRSSAQWTTKDDMDKFITSNGMNLKVIQDDLDKLHADITAANAVVVVSQGQHVGNLPTTNTGPSNPSPIDPKNPDPYGYMGKQQNLSLTENFGTVKVPIGNVGFSAWQKNPWNIDIKSREYHSTTVVGTDENQRQYFENKFTVKVDGKNYDVPIKTATTKQILPEAKFSFWNPEVFLAIDGGLGVNPIRGEVVPNVRLGIMSYGKYKTQPMLSVLQVGIGMGLVSRRPQLTFSPVMYNLGQNIPFLHNTYIGPSLSVGTDGGVNIIGGLAVGL